MKIKETELGRISEYQGCLVYGPDYGLVEEKSKQIAKSIIADLQDPFNIAELSAAELIADPAKLGEELSAVSFSGGRRLIWIKISDNEISDNIRKCEEIALDCLDLLCTENFLLLTLGELKPTSKFRKEFEAGKNIASLPCYRQEGYNLVNVIKTELEKHQLKYNADILAYLQTRLGNNSAITKSEINKVAIYMGDDKTLNLEKLVEIIGDDNNIDNIELPDTILSGDLSRLENIIHKFSTRGVYPASMVRMVNNHLYRLYSVKISMESGGNFDSATRSLRPPLFFRDKPIFLKHLNKFSTKNLLQLMNYIIKAEISVKSSEMNPETLCQQYLEKLAMKFYQKKQTA